MSPHDSLWYPDSFCLELGRFVIVFADVEGVAGELIELSSANRRLPTPRAFRSSGQQLTDELKKCIRSDNFQSLCSELEELTAFRNLIMHGEWSFHSEQSAMILKRKFDSRTKSPGYDHAPAITPRDISMRANRLRHIESALGNYLADEMELRS